MKNLKQRYEKICNEYVALFCQKQDMEFECWVSNHVGGICYCGDYFFNFGDIVHDINTDQPKGLIIDWYNDNLNNYSLGLRIKDLK